MVTEPQLVERSAQIISQAMVTHNMSQNKLSKITNISYGQLGRKLSGRLPFNIVELNAIAVALGIPPSDTLPPVFREQNGSHVEHSSSSNDPIPSNK